MKEQVSPEYLDLNQLAAYASVARNTLKKWIKSGMPHYQVNRCIRVRVDEFNHWMSRFRVGASEDLDDMLDQVMREVETND
jgi:predicted site-specific integrase-resolvase